jgi:hypothetical protein
MLGPSLERMMRISRKCKNVPLNWGALPELLANLNRHGVVVTTASVQIQRFPDRVEHGSLKAAHRDILKNGPPLLYEIDVDGKQGKQNIHLRIAGLVSFAVTSFLNLTISGTNDIQLLDAVGGFLELEPADPVAPTLRPAQTAFIAHRFDIGGTLRRIKLRGFLSCWVFR